MARLIAAKVSSKPGQDLVLVHPGKRRLDLLNVRETVSQKGDSSTPVSLDVEGVPVAVLPMRLSPDALDDLVIATDSPAGLVTTVTTFASIFTVTNTNLTGTGSFEEAISDADSNPGMDTIVFNIPGSGPHTIVPGRNIRCPTEPVLIDATTQPGFSGTPLVEIDGSLAVTGTGNNGLCLSGNGVVIRGFAINNYVHPSPSVVGIGIAAMSAGGHIIEGNFIGTDPSGLVSIPNERGVTVGLDPPGSGITIGGTVAAARNVISGNQTQVWIGAPGNEIVGNYIGTDATGTSLLAGTETGIHISGSNNNNIGTNIPGSGNVIVPGGAFSAILISPGISGVATGNLIQGNLIGTNASGTVALSTGLGVDIQTASNTVGGTSPFTRNVISSDGGERGVHLGGSGATLNQVQGNYIGTDSSGTVALGNNYGVFVGNANGNLVGGASAGAGNVVSGNVVAGVEINGGSDNIIQGNLVGTDAVGTAPIPGGDGAIYVFSATDTLVLDNVTGSTDFGVVLSGASPTTGTKLAGNFIGTDASGTIDLGHSSVGVLVQADATGNLIGGLLSVERNIIAFNGDAGVRVAAAGPANRIWFNSIHSNVGLGIDLEGIGVNPNDAGDADVGSNDLQNFPDLSFADTSGTTVTVGGTLSSEPNTTYMLQFFASPSCDPSGNGEGMTYLGSDITATDGTGLGVFRQRVTGGIIPAGQAVTATATDPSGSTSEFSQCRNAVGVPPGLVPNLGFDDLTGLSLSWDPVPDAITYHLYQGVDQDLPKLLSSEADSCRRYSTAATTTSNVITDSPDEGMMLWYLMTTEGTYGEGNPADGTKPRQLDSSGDCQATCLHGSCTTGGPLDPLCGVCEANICQADPFCCQQEWDDLCVEEVRTICGSLTCQESAGQCAHPLCEEGDLLLNKCDDPPVTPSCADAICAVDPFCCQQSWDSVCVGEVATICSFNCD